jgi:hypothetical protein
MRLSYLTCGRVSDCSETDNRTLLVVQIEEVQSKCQQLGGRVRCYSPTDKSPRTDISDQTRIYIIVLYIHVY